MKSETIQTSHNTTMSFWAQKIMAMLGENNDFVLALLAEEAAKTHRLTEMSLNIGLPIYESFGFVLPDEIDKLMALCTERAENGWKLNLRFSDMLDKLVLFRQLDISVDAIVQVIKGIEHIGKYKVRVAPYKLPNISGTLWICRGVAILEMAYGPHEWITKFAPPGNQIFGCYYNYLTVKYTTDVPEIRHVLFRCLRDVVKMVLGYNVSQLSEVQRSVYTEFHWHETLGYRFLECSFSPVWTTDRTTRQNR